MLELTSMPQDKWGVKRCLIAVLCLSILVLTSCGSDSAVIYTLYRNSPLDINMRIHMATFDAGDANSTYNQENCSIVAELMQNRVGINVNYWCEQGEFRD